MKTNKHYNSLRDRYMSAAELQEEVIAELRRRSSRTWVAYSTAIETDGSRPALLRARWASRMKIVATERS